MTNTIPIEDGAEGAEGVAMHTPGPWKADVGFCLTQPRIGLPATVRANGQSIITVRARPNAETAAANARLIAAAPELLAALEICLAVAKRPLEKMLNVNGETPYDIGIAALRKAKGSDQ